MLAFDREDDQRGAGRDGGLSERILLEDGSDLIRGATEARR